MGALYWLLLRNRYSGAISKNHNVLVHIPVVVTQAKFLEGPLSLLGPHLDLGLPMWGPGVCRLTLWDHAVYFGSGRLVHKTRYTRRAREWGGVSPQHKPPRPPNQLLSMSLLNAKDWVWILYQD